MKEKKYIQNRKFTIEFGYQYPVLTLEICEHSEFSVYVRDGDIEKWAQMIVNDKTKCIKCGKGLE